VKKIKFEWTVVLSASVFIFIPFFYFGNNSLVVTNIEYINKKLPPAFKNYKILQISDLHNKEFGKDQKTLVNHTKEINPDLIVITGDLIDGRKPNIDIAINYVKQAKEVAPIYFISGNHEEFSNVYNDLEKKLEELGVTILDDNSQVIEKNGANLTLLGLKDPTFSREKNQGNSPFEEKLKTLKEKDDNFTILLSHRPEYINLYVKYNIDLVFSGHAHGGQVRVPFVGGLYAPGQGLFPKYTSGIYSENNTSMVVSRGLGNSIFPLRVFNRPELLVVTLKDGY